MAERQDVVDLLYNL